ALHRVAQYYLPVSGEALREGPTVIADNQDGRFAVVVNGTLGVWDGGTHQMIGKPTRLGPSTGRAQFWPKHPDRVAVAADSDGSLHLWSISTHHLIASLPTHIDTQSSNTLTFDPTGDRVATLTPQHTLQVWNLETREPVGQAIPVPDMAELHGF